MKTNGLFWALSWAAIGSLSIVQGCGGDDDDDAATGGKGGTAGSGTGGSTGGSAGSGTGGKGGTAGKGGSAGSTTGGTSTGGTGGAPGGVGGEGGEGGAEDRLAVCTEYCQLYVDKDCENSAANTYDDEPDCRNDCVAADWEIGTRGAAMGDTIHCRLTHAGLAAAPSPGPDETHCGHASFDSTGNCQ